MKENNKLIGKYGEDLAVEFLENLGYEIIEKNFMCKIGEIDIIAKDRDEIVFIEVKTRNTLLYGNPIEAVDKRKRKHIYKTAEYYLLINDLLDSYVRIDIIEIILYEHSYKINHIKKAIIDRN